MRIVLLCCVVACSVPAKHAPGDGMVGGDGGGGGGDGGDGLTVTLTGQPPALGNQASVTFAFTVSAPATVECRLDSDDYAPCPPPSKTFDAVVEGMHAFDLRATAGADQAAIPTYSFAIDTTPPMLAITGQPASASPVAAGQFEFTIGDATSATCALDASAAAPCTSPYSYSGLGDGSHTFALQATDAAGNTASKSYTWTVQTTPPMLAITSEPPALSAVASGQFQFTIGDSVAVTCQLDAQAAQPCTSPWSYTGVADGSHTFTLRGTDAASNVTTTSYTWTIDTTPPSLAITGGPASYANTTTAQFAFTTGDASTVTCQLDGNGAAACTSPWSYTGLAQGSHSFTLRGTDAAGNTATKVYTWTVDTVAPVVMLTGAPAAETNSKTATFSFTTTEGSTTCRLDNGSIVACSSPTSYSSLADGAHGFSVTATDLAGNTGSKSYNWLVDTTPPTISGLAYTCNVSVITVTWSVVDNGSGLYSGTCSYAGSSWDCFNARSYTGNLMGSSTVFYVTYTDAVGNSATKMITISSLAC